MNEQTTATCQSELERVFTVLQRIEDKLFSPTLQDGCREPINSKVIELRDDIAHIADRLQIIDEKLTVLGK